MQLSKLKRKEGNHSCSIHLHTWVPHQFSSTNGENFFHAYIITRRPDIVQGLTLYQWWFCPGISMDKETCRKWNPWISMNLQSSRREGSCAFLASGVGLTCRFGDPQVMKSVGPKSTGKGGSLYLVFPTPTKLLNILEEMQWIQSSGLCTIKLSKPTNQDHYKS